MAVVGRHGEGGQRQREGPYYALPCRVQYLICFLNALESYQMLFKQR